PLGTLNKVFDQKLLEDFAEHGEGVIKIVRIEKPVEYLKVIAARMPKEFHVKATTLEDMTDDEICDALETIRAHRARLVGSSEARPIGDGTRKALAGPADPEESRH